MQTIDVGRLRVAGALGSERTADGVIPRRLPDWTRPQLTDPLLTMVVQMPSGCRLDLRTDTRAVELDVMLSTFALPDNPGFPSVFDVVVDGELVDSQSTREGNLLVLDLVDVTKSRWEPGEPVTMRFELPAGDKHLELFLPHNAVVEMRALRVDDGAAVTEPAPSGTKWIHYGSSISHCLEAEQPTGVWPVIAARTLGYDLTSMGLGGACHLDPFAARTIRDAPVDLISIKAGINIINGDTMRERTFGPVLHGFLDTVRDGHPTTPIVLISPIFCPSAEDHPGPTVPNEDRKFRVVPRPAELATGALSLRRVRQLMEEIVGVRDDKHLRYIDGLRLFGPDDAADLPDDLHPNPAGYRRMAERFCALMSA